MFDSHERAPVLGYAGRALLLVLAVASAAACQVEANANVKSSASGTEANASVDETTTTTPPAGITPEVGAPAATQPSAPPAECPLTCFEAQGPVKVSVTPEEQAQLRGALEPVLGKMRACSSPEEWRRRGSPVVHLRLGPDGKLADIGVDPQQDRDTYCFDSAAHDANPAVTLPGRKTVRCVERCAAEPRAARAKKRAR